ncbi:hypothetical protein KFK09_004037 [Dendrobium nobile]|uniref:Endonuclease/exonuclease/phosphatase domain-containing protein n=1 Tax=Dendrobium nobile TaxID=94219 RepID=A0A8T3BZF9_DENNO|nr:hypothetical protein KFK09_004037 [Dendrobium nobile]
MVPAGGLSGGLLILWRKDLAVFSVLETSSQLVVGKLEVIGKGSWIIASVYGSTDAQERKLLWENLEKHCSVDLPLVVGGDFNCILSQEEKRGGRKFSMSQGSKEFQQFLINSDLHEVKASGPRFTWCNSKSGSARIFEKLDRCLINSLALNTLQVALVKHLSRIASNHCSVLFEMFKPVEVIKRDIQYEEVWASYHGATALVRKIWNRKSIGNPASILNLKFKKALRGLFSGLRRNTII